MNHRPLKPPRGAFIATSVLFDPRLKTPVRETLIQLLALAWGENSTCTPPLTYRLLSQLLSKSQRTLFGHFRVLRDDLAALRLQPAGDASTFVIEFAAWVIPSARGVPPGKTLQFPDREESLNIESGSLISDLDPPDSDHASQKRVFCNQKPLRKMAKTYLEKPLKWRLSKAILNALRSAGIFEVLLPEVDASIFSNKEIRALLAWVKDEQPAEKTAPIFMARLRLGAHPPERYFHPPCSRCGGYGKHAGDCPRRYLDGTYEHLIDH